MSTPTAFIVVVGVTAAVVILCILGISFTGLFNLGNTTTGDGGVPPVPGNAPGSRVAVDQFPDGQWAVNTDIRAGTYATTVPADSPGCTWERNASTDGTSASVLETGTGKAGESLVANIPDTDKVFQSSGCGTWHRTGDSPITETSVGDGLGGDQG